MLDVRGGGIPLGGDEIQISRESKTPVAPDAEVRGGGILLGGESVHGWEPKNRGLINKTKNKVPLGGEKFQISQESKMRVAPGKPFRGGEILLGGERHQNSRGVKTPLGA